MAASFQEYSVVSISYCADYSAGESRPTTRAVCLLSRRYAGGEQLHILQMRLRHAVVSETWCETETYLSWILCTLLPPHQFVAPRNILCGFAEILDSW